MGRTIFANANLLDGENPARRGASIVVENDRIAATSGAPLPARPEDTVVDLRGLTLMPGMVSGHFHAVYHDYGRPGVPMETRPIRQAYRALGNCRLALAGGFTSVVGAATHHDIDAVLAEAIDSGMVEGPRFVPCSRALAPVPDDAPIDLDSPHVLACRGADTFRRAAEQEIGRGAKILKLFAASGHGMTGTRDIEEEEMRAVVETAREHGVRTRAHIAGKEKILRCVRLGIDILDHADGMDEECIDAILERGCFVLPSLYLPYLATRNHGRAGGGTFDPAAYEQMRDGLSRAARAGVKFVPGDDYGVYEMPHGTYAGELACYVEQAGIDAHDVIRWATKNGGELTGLAGLGTIAQGNPADLVLVDGDPSRDIGVLGQHERIVAVMKGGEVVSGRLPPEMRNG